jgi:hypothetical protein
MEGEPGSSGVTTVAVSVAFLITRVGQSCEPSRYLFETSSLRIPEQPTYARLAQEVG